MDKIDTGPLRSVIAERFSSTIQLSNPSYSKNGSATSMLLPPELELRIFRLAVENDKATMLKMMLVARRVMVWIEPLLYKFLWIKGGRKRGLKLIDFYDMLRRKSPDFWLKNVETMIMEDYLKAAVYHDKKERIFALCSGVTDLVLVGETAFDSISHLRPHRLSCVPYDMIGIPTPLLLDPLFSNVSHLELGVKLSSRHTVYLGALPKLTHLSLETNIDASFDYLSSETRKLVKNCRLLQCLLFVYGDDINTDETASLSLEDCRRIAKAALPVSLTFSLGQSSRLDWADRIEHTNVWEKAEKILSEIEPGWPNDPKEDSDVESLSQLLSSLLI